MLLTKEPGDRGWDSAHLPKLGALWGMTNVIYDWCEIVDNLKSQHLFIGEGWRSIWWNQGRTPVHFASRVPQFLEIIKIALWGFFLQNSTPEIYLLAEGWYCALGLQ